MAGAPRSGPGFTQILGAAQDSGDVEPNRRGAGKIEKDSRAARSAGIVADRQQAKDAVLIAAAKAAIRHAGDGVKGHRAQDALMAFLSRQRRQPALPPKAVGDEDKALLAGEIGEIANRDQRVLQTS